MHSTGQSRQSFLPSVIAMALGMLLGLAFLAILFLVDPPKSRGGEPGPESLVRGFTPTPTPVSQSGTRAVIDIPATLHLRNTGGMGPGGPGTGAGLCVFTSVEVAARWHCLPQIAGFQKWMTHKEGGGWPQKLDQMLKQFCREKGVKCPPYVQHTGGDPTFLEAVYRNRFMPAMTHTQVHMVNGAHLDQAIGAIIDNNNPAHWEWANRSLYLRTWGAVRSQDQPLFPRPFREGILGDEPGWVFAWTTSPPPPGPDSAVPTPAPAPGPSPFPDDEGDAGPSPCPGPGPCPLPNHPRPRPCPGPGPCPHWETVRWRDGTVNYKLYDASGNLLGVQEADGWHPAFGEGWLAKPQGTPPVPLPGAERKQPETEPDFTGVVQQQIDRTRPRYWVSGVEVSREQALAALGDTLPDESGLHYLTVIVADEAARKAWKAGWLPDPRVRLNVYTADDWPVQTGRVKAAVTLQDPKGRVVKTADMADKETVAEVLKYTDPHYKPAPPPAPVPPKPSPCPCPGPNCPCPGPKPCPNCPNCPAPTPSPANPDQSPTAPPAGSGNGLIPFLLGLVILYLRR